MSRIQDILNKADREGTARRIRSVADEYAVPPSADEPRDRAPSFPSEPESVQGRAYERGPDRSSESEKPPVVLHHQAMHVARARRGISADDDATTAPVVSPDAPARSHEWAVAPPDEDTPRGEDEDLDAAESSARPSAELDPLLVAALAPTSIAAEQYRSLRTRLKRAENGRSLRTIAITSPSKGDGKSLTAANLALTMAQEFQQRVLLLDADLRRPSAHRLFGLAESPGLSDVLLSGADLDQALVFLSEYHLTVLPAGVPPSHPAELLGSTIMRRTLDTLRTRFDRILIDVPPVAPLADLHIIAQMVDGLLMIVRAGITPKPAIERALAGLDAGKVLGLVLNESGGEGTDEYDYEGYGYLAG